MSGSDRLPASEASALHAAVHSCLLAMQETTGRWYFGRLACDMFNANDVLFSTASLLHLCCVSVDRYVAITDPFNYDRKMSPRVVAWLLAGVWMTSTLVSHVPIHLGWYSADRREPNHATSVPDTSFADGVCVFEVNQVNLAFSTRIGIRLPRLLVNLVSMTPLS